MHYTLGVVLENISDLDDTLEPYLEHNEECFEFMDCTEGLKIRFEQSKLKNFALFAKKLGYVQKGNAWGYYGNPNGKCDWYELGGRWSQSLLIKEDVKEEDFKVEIPFIFSFNVGKTSKIQTEECPLFVDFTDEVKANFEKEGLEFETLHDFADRQGFAEMDGRYGYYRKPNLTHTNHLKEAPEGYRWVDVARFRDIQWEMMNQLRKTPFKTYAVFGVDNEWIELDYEEEAFFDEFIREQDPNLFFAIVDYHV